MQKNLCSEIQPLPRGLCKLTAPNHPLFPWSLVSPMVREYPKSYLPRYQITMALGLMPTIFWVHSFGVIL
jgi:hypothetical protein